MLALFYVIVIKTSKGHSLFWNFRRISSLSGIITCLLPNNYPQQLEWFAAVFTQPNYASTAVHL